METAPWAVLLALDADDLGRLDREAIPDDLLLAIHLLASQVRNAAEKGIAGALKSETQGRYSYELLTGTGADAGDLNGTTIVQALSILKAYREVIV